MQQLLQKKRDKQQLDLSATAVVLVDLAQPLAAMVVCGALSGRESLLVSDALLFAGAWTSFKTRVIFTNPPISRVGPGVW